MTRYLALLLALAIGTAGCQYLFPSGPDKPQPVDPVDPDKPDKDPDLRINDPHKIRESAKAACADVPADAVLRLYGITSGLADYIVINANEIDTTVDAFNLLTATVENSGWQKGSYPAWSAAVSKAFNDAGLKESKPMTEVKTQVIDTFRLLSLGCLDAYDTKKK